MENSGKLNRVLSLVIVLILALAANDAFVFAQDGGDKETSTPEQEFLGDANERAVTYGRVSVSPAAFQPDSFLWSYTRRNYTELQANWDVNAVFLAPLTLPDGVTVTNLTIGYYDISPDGYVWIGLYRQEIWGGEVQEMAYTDSQWPIDGYHYKMDQTINYALIDQINYTYFISAKFETKVADPPFSADVRLVGVRVGYQNPTTTYLPLIDN